MTTLNVEKKKQISFYLEPSLHAQLRKEAAVLGIRANDLILGLMKDGMAERIAKGEWADSNFELTQEMDG